MRDGVVAPPPGCGGPVPPGSPAGGREVAVGAEGALPEDALLDGDAVAADEVTSLTHGAGRRLDPSKLDKRKQVLKHGTQHRMINDWMTILFSILD